MKFSDVIGFNELKDQLVSMVKNSRVSHATIFEEEDGGGGLALALATIQYINCLDKKESDSCGVCASCSKIQKLVHPDLHFVYPVNGTSKSGSDRKPISDDFIQAWRDLVLKNPYPRETELNKALNIENKLGIISVSEARSIIEKLNLSSFEGGNKYIIMWLPERMRVEAANALLKIVEEPFPNTYILLITRAPQKIIKTIQSRCMRISLPPIALVRENVSSHLGLIVALIRNCLSMNLVSNLKLSEEMAGMGREQQKSLLLYSMEIIRELLRLKNGIPVTNPALSGEFQVDYDRLPDKFFEIAFSSLEEAKVYIESNVNAKMVFCDLVNVLTKAAQK